MVQVWVPAIHLHHMKKEEDKWVFHIGTSISIHYLANLMLRGILHNPTLLNMAKDDKGILLDMWIFSKVSKFPNFDKVNTFSTFHSQQWRATWTSHCSPLTSSSASLNCRSALSKMFPRSKIESSGFPVSRPCGADHRCWSEPLFHGALLPEPPPWLSNQRSPSPSRGDMSIGY